MRFCTYFFHLIYSFQEMMETNRAVFFIFMHLRKITDISEIISIQSFISLFSKITFKNLWTFLLLYLILKATYGQMFISAKSLESSCCCFVLALNNEKVQELKRSEYTFLSAYVNIYTLIYNISLMEYFEKSWKTTFNTEEVTCQQCSYQGHMIRPKLFCTQSYSPQKIFVDWFSCLLSYIILQLEKYFRLSVSPKYLSVRIIYIYSVHNNSIDIWLVVDNFWCVTLKSNIALFL